MKLNFSESRTGNSPLAILLHGPVIRPDILHFLQSQTGIAVEARRIIDECMSSSDDRANLEKFVDKNAGVALVKL